MLVSKAKENGKELTMKQAKEMIKKASSLNDDELTNISGGNFIDDFIDIYNDAAERDTKCKYGAPVRRIIDNWVKLPIR